MWELSQKIPSDKKEMLKSFQLFLIQSVFEHLAQQFNRVKSQQCEVNEFKLKRILNEVFPSLDQSLLHCYLQAVYRLLHESSPSSRNLKYF